MYTLPSTLFLIFLRQHILAVFDLTKGTFVQTNGRALEIKSTLPLNCSTHFNEVFNIEVITLMKSKILELTAVTISIKINLTPVTSITSIRWDQLSLIDLNKDCNILFLTVWFTKEFRDFEHP